MLNNGKVSTSLTKPEPGIDTLSITRYEEFSGHWDRHNLEGPAVEYYDKGKVTRRVYLIRDEKISKKDFFKTTSKLGKILYG